MATDWAPCSTPIRVLPATIRGEPAEEVPANKNVEILSVFVARPLNSSKKRIDEELAKIHPDLPDTRSIALHRWGTSADYETWRWRIGMEKWGIINNSIATEKTTVRRFAADGTFPQTAGRTSSGELTAQLYGFIWRWRD